MITMEAVTIRRGITPITNQEGQQTGLFFDLTNEAVRDLVEDLMDTLIAAERVNEPTVTSSEVIARIRARKDD